MARVNKEQVRQPQMPVQMPALFRKSSDIYYYNFTGKKHHLRREYGIMLVTAHIDETGSLDLLLTFTSNNTTAGKWKRNKAKTAKKPGNRNRV